MTTPTQEPSPSAEGGGGGRKRVSFADAKNHALIAQALETTRRAEELERDAAESPFAEITRLEQRIAELEREKGELRQEVHAWSTRALWLDLDLKIAREDFQDMHRRAQRAESKAHRVDYYREYINDLHRRYSRLWIAVYEGLQRVPITDSKGWITFLPPKAPAQNTGGQRSGDTFASERVNNIVVPGEGKG